MIVKQLWKQHQSLQVKQIDQKINKKNSHLSKPGKRLRRLTDKNHQLDRKSPPNYKNQVSLTQQSEQFFATSPKFPQFFSKNTEKQKKYLKKAQPKTQSQSKQQIELQKTLKLKELYSKKADLLHKLKIINKQARIKTVPFEDQIQPDNKEMVQQKKTSKLLYDSSSRYLVRLVSRASSRAQYLSKSRIKQPLSIASLQKNRKVLSFIQQVHQESMQRDMNRLQQFHRHLKSKIQSQIQQKMLKMNQSSHLSRHNKPKYQLH